MHAGRGKPVASARHLLLVAHAVAHSLPPAPRPPWLVPLTEKLFSKLAGPCSSTGHTRAERENGKTRPQKAGGKATA